MNPKVDEGNYSPWTFQNLIVYIILTELCRVQGLVTTENKEVELGGRVTLRCVPRRQYDTVIVSWQKKMNGNAENIAVFHNITGPNIIQPNKHQINFTVPGVKNTAITFWNASIQEHGCYKCIFNTFPLGPVTGNPCLSVYDPLNSFIHYNTTDGHMNATCFATGFPSPSVSWLTPGDKMNENQVTNPNGTVTVMSSILVSRSCIEQELICRVTHRGKEVDVKMARSRGHSHQNHVVLILLALMPMLLLMN